MINWPQREAFTDAHSPSRFVTQPNNGILTEDIVATKLPKLSVLLWTSLLEKDRTTIAPLKDINIQLW